MGITFPDNAKRIDRVVELGTDAENYLQDSTSAYDEFHSLLATVNSQLTTVYENAGLKPPAVRSVDIFKEANVDHLAQTGEAVVDVAEIIADVSGLVAQVKYLAPAATRTLVASGAMAEETAAKVLATIPEKLFGRQFEITVSDIAGNVLGGIVGGVAIAGLDVGIQAIEGAELRGKLRDSINQLFPMRTTLNVAKLKAIELTSSLRAIKTTMDVLEGAGIVVTDEFVRMLVQKDADPSLTKANEITVDSVHNQVKKFDTSRQSYTNDDPDPPSGALHDRVVQLGADAQNFLSQTKDSYAKFENLMKEVNTRIAELYEKAGLAAPSTSAIDILGAQKSLHNIETVKSVIEVSSIVVGVGVGVAQIAHFGPAATFALVDAGLITEETASAVLLLAFRTDHTVGALAGGIVRGLVSGEIAVGIGLAIDAFEGARERDELYRGIQDTDKLRAQLKLSLDKSNAVVDVLQSIIDACKSFPGSEVPVTRSVIEERIQKNAIPSLNTLASIDKHSVLSSLRDLDKSRQSWTEEDDAWENIPLPFSRPTYVIAGTPLPDTKIPSVPSGMKLVTLKKPDSLDREHNYPVLRVDRVTYWPLSFVDNRTSMAIAAFDSSGGLVKVFERPGARDIYRIEKDVKTNEILFIGREEHTIKMKWSELTDITVKVSDGVPTSKLPPSPPGMKTKAITSPSSLESPDLFPILLIGTLRVIPFSFVDNRIALGITIFDSNNEMRRQLIRYGGRYIFEIREHVSTKLVTFVCQGGNTIAVQAPWFR